MPRSPWPITVRALAGIALAASMTFVAGTPSHATPTTKAPMAISPVAVDSQDRPVAVATAATGSVRSFPANSAGHPMSDTTDPSSVSIIGPDQRWRVWATTAFPSSAVVHITRNGNTHCTGWMISDDTLVTAGHCLYSRASSSWVSGLAFTPARNGAASPYGTVTAVKRIADANYIRYGDTRQDWGIVKLSSSIGNRTGWFGLRWQSASYNGSYASVRGYPGDKPFGTMWSMFGSITQSTPNGLCYSMDTMGGQSGSPVYNTSNQAIAIHTMGTGYHGQNGCAAQYNAGTRITQGLFNLILAER